MRSSRFLYLAAALFVASCGLHPAYAQTPQQVVGAQLDKLAAASKSQDSALAALAAWTARIGATRVQQDSAIASIRALLATQVATLPVVTAPAKDTASVTPIVTAYVRAAGDDYTAYADTKGFLARVAKFVGGTGPDNGSYYSDGMNANLASIDKSVLYNGHQTVKYTQPAGGNLTPQLWVTLPAPLTKAWFRFKLRFSPGWTTVGTTPNSANAYKIFGWAWQGNNGRGNLVWTNTDEYQLESYSTFNGSVPNYTYKGGYRESTEWSGDRWYDYIIYSEQLDNSRVRTRWWFAPDGQTPVLKYDITSTLDTSKYGNQAPINRVMVGINYNSARTKDQALWYGQWEVVDGSTNANPFNLSL